jgi:MFS family permease
VADRIDKRRILFATQAAMAVQALVLAVLTLSGSATLPLLYLLAVVQGIAVTFDNPARQAFVTEMVGNDEVANAVGLNSAMFNLARILGPALGGLLIDAVGVGVCFLLNAASFLAVIAGLALMHPAELFRSTPTRRAKGQLEAGLRYAWEEPTLRLVLGMMALIGTFAMNFAVVLPVVAKQVFGGTASTFGFMSAAMGVGALVGALGVAARSRPTIPLLTTAAGAFGVAMAADALAPHLGVEMVALVATGAASIVFMATANATVQLTSRPEMRGRVMSIYLLLFLGSTPIGGPLVGWVGARWGARWSLAVGAAACLLAAGTALWWMVRRGEVGRESPRSRTGGDGGDDRIEGGQGVTTHEVVDVG